MTDEERQAAIKWFKNRPVTMQGAKKMYALAVEALEQPTRTDCEYCHTDRDGYVFPLEKNSHAFIDHDRIVLKANGWRGEAKINYCPICGRRLT